VGPAAATWLGWTDVPFAVQAVAAPSRSWSRRGLVMARLRSRPARPPSASAFLRRDVYVAERKDRLVEDFRLLRWSCSTAFEGRLDRHLVNDRVDDYRRLPRAAQEGRARPKGDDKKSVEESEPPRRRA
jgi:hypothetical protein